MASRSLVGNRDASADDGEKAAQPLRVAHGQPQVLIRRAGHLLGLGRAGGELKSGRLAERQRQISFGPPRADGATVPRKSASR